jgi:hypothetical protein
MLTHILTSHNVHNGILNTTTKVNIPHGIIGLSP